MVELLPNTANFFRKIVMSPCARPWFVYVETFAPAFIKMVITIGLLQWDDIVRMRAETLAKQGARASKRGIGHARGLRLLAFEPEHERTAARGLKTLLKITQPLENIGFVVLLYNATEEFYFDWTSLIIRQPYCEAPVRDRPFSRSRQGGRIGILPGGDITPLPILDNNGAGYASDSFHVIIPAGAYDAIFAVQVQHTGTGTVVAKCRMNYVGDGVAGSIESEEVVLEPGHSASIVASGGIFFKGPLGGTVTWEMVGTAVPIGLASSHANAIVMRTPSAYVL